MEFCAQYGHPFSCSATTNFRLKSVILERSFSKKGVLLGTHSRISMAKSAMVSAAMLVILLVLIEYSVIMAMASDADVNIYNLIPGPDTIRVDCIKWKPGPRHHIFTPQTLAFGQHWGWGFTPHIWGWTKYYCDFSWKTYTTRVRVWIDSNPEESETQDPRPCTHCEWHATPEGFYRMTSDRGEPPALEARWA